MAVTASTLLVGMTEMLWINLLGYVASASVLVTFCMSSMVPLRAVAICSNVLFAAFGALAHIYPVLALHAILLPVNIVRLMQVVISDQEAAPIVASIMLAPLLGAIRAKPDVSLQLAEWWRRARSRRKLSELDERDRHDLGISRCDAQREAQKPFWRA
jgi:uncharacterized protein YjiS (DUF1127 family)